MALGKQIRRYRAALGLTLEQLEARTGVGVGTIAALEGRDSERSKYAARLAAGLGLSLEQLLDEAAQYPPDVVLAEPGGDLARAAEDAAGDLRIPRFDTGGAMGAGVELRDQPGVIQSLRVSQEWLHKNLRHYTAAANLCVVTGFGDSMRPMYNPGDPLLVDLGVVKADVDGVFFFRVGNEGFIKRLQRIPSAQGLLIRAKSENTKYDAWDITEDMDLQIFGRVLKVWRSEDL
ncbi:XRE family transcriptional regulator [Achromobacter ruhlandii]|uniref:XRE family transcriptional regulator n=1 Tax=Achromobacter ruhlandii TaxID=72557 RepID=UPI000C262289|nr:S24 family peptidase [Achromobacter ruhlandii]PJM86950.1 LexA family transcriptional repressor [Achromobacter ruhlandii]